jgi:hypothetical protein
MPNSAAAARHRATNTVWRVLATSIPHRTKTCDLPHCVKGAFDQPPNSLDPGTNQRFRSIFSDALQAPHANEPTMK